LADPENKRQVALQNICGAAWIKAVKIENEMISPKEDWSFRKETPTRQKGLSKGEARIGQQTTKLTQDPGEEAKGEKKGVLKKK